MQATPWCMQKKLVFQYTVRLTDTSRGADSLISLVAISNKIVSQKFNMVLLPWVFIERQRKQNVSKLNIMKMWKTNKSNFLLQNSQIWIQCCSSSQCNVVLPTGSSRTLHEEVLDCVGVGSERFFRSDNVVGTRGESVWQMLGVARPLVRFCNTQGSRTQELHYPSPCHQVFSVQIKRTSLQPQSGLLVSGQWPPI